MKKIPTLYQRDPATNRKYVTGDPHPDCLWVLNGEGRPTFKWDGTSVLIDDDREMWKRRELKPGKPTPDGYRLEGVDPETGKTVGWVQCDRDNPDDQWHWEAYDDAGPLAPGTYELLGPKVQGNPHHFTRHQMRPHGERGVEDPPATYDGLVIWMAWARDTYTGFEGIVWHHPDGRMAKLKAKDIREIN